ANGRPMTTTLPDQCVSDVAMRASPISAFTVSEIRRLARPLSLGGCRLTFAATQGDGDMIAGAKILLPLGVVIAQRRVVADGDHGPDSDADVWVIEIR